MDIDDIEMDRMFPHFVLLIVVIIGWVTIFAIVGIKMQATETYEIVSIYNDKSTNGKFILGTEGVNEVEYYYIVVKSGENEYKIERLPAKNTNIIKAENREPCIVYHPKGNYKLYVPPDTIMKKYKADYNR